MWLCVWKDFINCKVMYQFVYCVWDFHSYSRDFCIIHTAETFVNKAEPSLALYPTHGLLTFGQIIFPWSGLSVCFLWDPFLIFSVNQSVWLKYWLLTNGRGCVSGHSLRGYCSGSACCLLSHPLLISFSKPGTFSAALHWAGFQQYLALGQNCKGKCIIQWFVLCIY